MTFEESTISLWLFLSLREKVDNLLVCNPVYLAKRQGAKTDFRDALHLAKELRGGHLSPVYHDSSHWMQLRVSVSGYLDVIQEIVRTKNPLKAVFRAEAINTDETSFYKNKNRVCELHNSSSPFVAERLFAQVEYLEEEKFKYQKLNDDTRDQSCQIQYYLSLLYVSRQGLAINISSGGYCMLVRHIQKSGGRIYGNKRVFGRRELRDVFIGAAETAARTDTSLRDHFDALKARGVSQKDAKVNLARKIAALTLSCLKNNETYQNDYKERIRERKKIRQLIATTYD